MKTKLSILTVVIFISILNFSCSKKSDSDFHPKDDFNNFEIPYEPEEDVIIPLHVGNSWTFVEENFSYVEIDTVEYTIMDEIRILHEGSYENVFIYGRSEVYGNLLKNQPNGLWNYGSYQEGDTFIDGHLQFKYPVQTGDEWSSNNSNGTSQQYTCEDDNATYTTSNKSYHCIKYRREFIWGSSMSPICDPMIPSNVSSSKKDSSVSYHYVAPGIGIIAIEAESNGAVYFRSELLNYYIQ